MRRALGYVLFFFCSISGVVGYSYTVADANVRHTCTPRCKDLSARAQWREVKTTAGSIYNTLEVLEASHTCHLHHFQKPEVAQCLHQNQADIVLIGGGTSAQSLFLTYASWWATGDADSFDTWSWLTAGALTNANIPSPISCAQFNLDPSGAVKWKSATTGNSTQFLLAAKTADPTTTGSFITYLKGDTSATVTAALGGLIAAGRTSRNGVFMINFGSTYGTDSNGLTDNGFPNILNYIKTWFPSYRVVLVGYTNPAPYPTDPSVRETGQKQYNYNVAMQAMVSSEYPKVSYLNTYDMDFSANAAKAGTPIFNLIALQRVLNVVCDNLAGTRECEEQLLGSSNCQSGVSGSCGCDFKSFTSSGATPTPAPASSSTPTVTSLIMYNATGAVLRNPVLEGDVFNKRALGLDPQRPQFYIKAVTSPTVGSVNLRVYDIGYSQYVADFTDSTAPYESSLATFWTTGTVWYNKLEATPYSAVSGTPGDTFTRRFIFTQYMRDSNVMKLVHTTSLVPKLGPRYTWFFFTAVGRTWMQARDLYVSKGGTLAMPKTQSDYDAMRLYLPDSYNAWIGIQKVNGVLTYIDGTPVTTTYWNDGEGTDSTALCVAAIGRSPGYNFGKWEDDLCSVGKKFVCQKAA